MFSREVAILVFEWKDEHPPPFEFSTPTISTILVSNSDSKGILHKDAITFSLHNHYAGGIKVSSLLVLLIRILKVMWGVTW